MALGCVLISTLLCTLFSSRPSDLHGVREISRRDRGRDALIVAQVALASVLLLGAGLLLAKLPSFACGGSRIRSATGFYRSTVTLPAPDNDSSRRVAFFREAAARLSTLPEVESAGATNVAPFSGTGTANRFRIEGEPAAEYRVAAWRAVTPGFFSTIGLPLKRGRLFTARDAEGSLEVVILSESMARKFWPNQDPIGKRLLWGRSGHPKTIVGVVGDLRDLAVDARPVPTMFRPFAQLSEAPMAFVIRTKSSRPSAAIGDIRREIWAVNRNAALDFTPVREAMSDSILRPRAGLAAFAAFAADRLDHRRIRIVWIDQLSREPAPTRDWNSSGARVPRRHHSLECPEALPGVGVRRPHYRSAGGVLAIHADEVAALRNAAYPGRRVHSGPGCFRCRIAHGKLRPRIPRFPHGPLCRNPPRMIRFSRAASGLGMWLVLAQRSLTVAVL